MNVVVSVDKDGNWVGKRLVEEQTPARPAWRELMESQHPASETPGLIRKNRIFGLIAVGGGESSQVKIERQSHCNTLETDALTAMCSYSFRRYHV